MIHTYYCTHCDADRMNATQALAHGSVHHGRRPSQADWNAAWLVDHPHSAQATKVYTLCVWTLAAITGAFVLALATALVVSVA